MIFAGGKSVGPFAMSVFTGTFPNTLRNLVTFSSCGSSSLLSRFDYYQNAGISVQQQHNNDKTRSPLLLLLLPPPPPSSPSSSFSSYQNYRKMMISVSEHSGIRKKFRISSSRQFHTTSNLGHKLHEFFDDEKNWTSTSVNVGRSWAKNELRTRSNEELHKLWYVLLKEMNMLLTMKAEYDRMFRPFPAPERLEKVEVSMDNLQDIVTERNRALSLLETGEPPHPRWIDDTDELDRPIRRLEEEHLIPKEHNKEFLKKYDNLGDWTRRFKLLWNEKQRRKDHYYRMKSAKLARRLLAKYPQLKENPQFLNEYCNSKVRPAEENPDVEKLIKEHEERND